MRRISVAVAASLVALAAFSAPAMAATLILTNNGNDLAEVIHSNGTQTATNLTLQSAPSALQIQYQSSDGLSVIGNGVAQVFGSSGGFTDLTITPLSNISFTAFKFNLNIPNGPTGGYSSDFTFDAQVFFTAGGSHLFDNVDLGAGNGANRVLISAVGSELIDKIVISDLAGVSTKPGQPTINSLYDFNALTQASFNFSGVPEPATWAEFILGFGLIGVMLRNRRRHSGMPTAA